VHGTGDIPTLCTADSDGEPERGCQIGIRYAPYRSYVPLGSPPIEPIAEHIPDQVPLGKAQRIEEVTNESPALPLSYSATPIKLTEDAEQSQTTGQGAAPGLDSRSETTGSGDQLRPFEIGVGLPVMRWLLGRCCDR